MRLCAFVVVVVLLCGNDTGMCVLLQKYKQDITSTHSPTQPEGKEWTLLYAFVYPTCLLFLDDINLFIETSDKLDLT